jgi:hypothetical protein
MIFIASSFSDGGVLLVFKLEALIAREQKQPNERLRQFVSIHFRPGKADFQAEGSRDARHFRQRRTP